MYTAVESLRSAITLVGDMGEVKKLFLSLPNYILSRAENGSVDHTIITPTK
jgi:hypothetical protein